MKSKNQPLSDQDAVKLIVDAFKTIVHYHSILEIKELIKTINPGKTENNFEKKYPKITFTISNEEIQSLKNLQVIEDDYSLNHELGTTITDPLTKLLYAISWKNGDLKKMKHIVKGIANTVDENEQDDAMVFYHFGKHLTRQAGHPIIDQHVLRAFEMYQNISNEILFDRIRRNDKCDNKELIFAYKDWWLQTIEPKIKGNIEHGYQIDKLLFTVGKRIKYRKI